MYIKEFEIRWNDLDANMHLANTSYINFMSHTRMAFFNEIGISHQDMARNRLGPVIFYEHMHYYREALPGRPVRVSLEVMGLSEDGMFFEFHHNFYNEDGIHLGHCEMMGGWMDMDTRKLSGLQPGMLRPMRSAEQATGFRVLTRADTRRFQTPRKNLDSAAG